MSLTRRGFVGAGIATLAVAGSPAVAETQRFVLRAAPVRTHIDGVEQELLGFNGSWPGPVLRARQGDTLRVRLENHLPDDGALVHWHGLRLPNRMDGVNVLTQDVIEPGNTFDYRFDVPDAGTYWYHSHYVSYSQVSRGLFGPLIVDERRPPDVDQDIMVQLFDMLTNSAGLYDDEFDPNQFNGAGRLGNVSMAIPSAKVVRRGERVRLRLINPSIDRVYDLRIRGVDGVVVALDGMPLDAPRSFSSIPLAPGQRCDVIGDVTGAVQFDDGGQNDLGRIAVSGIRERRIEPIPTLVHNSMPQPKGRVAKATVLMQGGAGGGTHGGFGTWALNDVSGLPRAPLVDARRGTTIRITLRNATAFDHVMHLHGHHFWEIKGGGALGDYRDGTLVPAGAERDILCVFDNPGNWMLHCHMLSHQADGMATWLRVR